MKHIDQICWSCNKACANGCCWFKDNKPVPNWKAIETKIKSTSEDGRVYYVSSYRVEKCPLYKCDNPVEELPIKIIAKTLNVTPDSVSRWKRDGKLYMYLAENKTKLKKLEYYYVDKI